MKKHILPVAALLLSLAACQSNDNEDPVLPADVDNTYVPIEMTEAETQLASQSTDFAFRLFRAVGQEEGQTLLSPLSATYALSMAANGATGETRDELLRGLGFENFDIDAVNAYNRKMVDELAGLDRTTVVIAANSVWLMDGFTALDSYTAALSENYAAEVRTEDRSAAKDAINAWCAEKTNGLIPQFLEEAPGGDVMLVNALYFCGFWQLPFDKAETTPAAFTSADGTQTEVQMMHNTDRYLYAQTDRFAVARLPYGNDAYSLHLILPAEGLTAADCLSALDAATWETVTDGSKVAILDISLPRFEVSGRNDLAGYLQMLGIEKSFSTTADFGNLSHRHRCARLDICNTRPLRVLRRPSLPLRAERKEHRHHSVYGKSGQPLIVQHRPALFAAGVSSPFRVQPSPVAGAQGAGCRLSGEVEDGTVCGVSPYR